MGSFERKGWADGWTPNHGLRSWRNAATGATTIDYTTRVSESVLVRLHYVAYVDSGARPDFDADEVEMLLVAGTRSWSDDLEEALVEELGEATGGELFLRDLLTLILRKQRESPKIIEKLSTTHHHARNGFVECAGLVFII